MGGVGSGRRPLRDEEKRHRILDKAWDVYEKGLADESVPAIERYKLAKDICGRDVGRDVKMEQSGGETKVIIIDNKKADNASGCDASNTTRLPEEVPGVN